MKFHINILLVGLFFVISSDLQSKDWSKVDECPKDKAACRGGINPKPVEPNLSHGRIVFDFDTDGCLASSPIVRTRLGYAANWGTHPSGALDEQCAYKNQLDNVDILYKKVCAASSSKSGNYCAEVYALYTVKDMSASGSPIFAFSHRHDLEHAVIWTIDGKANEVGVSAHSDLNNTIVEKFPRLSESPLDIDYNKFSVVYNKHGGRTHALRPSKGKYISDKKITINTEKPENPTGNWFTGHIIDIDSNLDDSYRNMIEEGSWGEATLKIRNDETIKEYLNNHLPGNWKKAGVKF